MIQRFTALLMATLLFLPSLVQAQSSGAMAAEIRKHHILAVENYDLADYASARDELLAAIEKAKQGGLDKDLVNAKTHVMLGAIYLIGMRNEPKAMEHFKVALQIAPVIQAEPPLDTEAVKSALARADAEVHPVITCKNMRGIDHQQVAQADSGLPVKVMFKAGPELRKGTAHLSYRTESATDFVEVDMAPQGECEYAGEIPADAVTGQVIHYFVAMKKDDGRYIAMRGNHKSPYPINVITTAKSPLEPEKTAREEVPDELLLGQPKRRGAGCAGCAAGLGAQGGPGTLGLVLVAWIALGRRGRRTAAARRA